MTNRSCLITRTWCAGALCFVIAVAALTLPAVAARQTPHPAVARIVVPERDGVSYGSGTLIDVRGRHGLVITNWHVVRDASDVVTVHFPDGFHSGARVLKVDDDWDLAVLVIWKPPADPVPLARSAPRPGQPLTIAGYGSGSYRAVRGRCTQYVAPGLDFPFEMVEVSVQARQGDSGGPIFNQRGELAGVLFGAGRGTTSGSYVGRVESFLASVVPDVGRASDTAIARSDSRRPEKQTASVPANDPQPGSETRSDDLFSSSAQAPRIPRIASLPDEHAPPPKPSFSQLSQSTEQSTVITWRDIAGETPLQQAKTVLAAIGILAIVLTVMRRM